MQAAARARSRCGPRGDPDVIRVKAEGAPIIDGRLAKPALHL